MSLTNESSRIRKLEDANISFTTEHNPLKRRRFNDIDNAIANQSENEEISIECPECNKSIKEDDMMMCLKCAVTTVCNKCYPSGDGFVCVTCDEFICEACWEGSFCGTCSELYCMDCGDFKPSKGVEMQCYSCQPWWKKDRPATDFCSKCGSSRSDAYICCKCEKRYCHMCFDADGAICDYCEDFECRWCNEMEFCDECDVYVCEDCEYEHEEQCTKVVKLSKEETVDVVREPSPPKIPSSNISTLPPTNTNSKENEVKYGISMNVDSNHSILQIIKQHKRVSMNELAEKFNVSATDINLQQLLNGMMEQWHIYKKNNFYFLF